MRKGIPCESSNTCRNTLSSRGILPFPNNLRAVGSGCFVISWTSSQRAALVVDNFPPGCVGIEVAVQLIGQIQQLSTVLFPRPYQAPQDVHEMSFGKVGAEK